jgi:hypothetical protein
MAKYLSTKDDSIGAKELPNGKILVARKIEGRNVLEVLEDPQEIADIIDKILPVAQHIIQALKDFFNNIFQRFPSVIVERGNNYVFTLQPAPFKAIDKVFYMNADDPTDRLYEFEHKHMGKAKNMLYKALKETGYLK